MDSSMDSSMDIKLQPLSHRNGCQGACDSAREAAGNGDPLLRPPAAEVEANVETGFATPKISAACRIKRELEKLSKPWMVIAAIVLLLAVVTVISTVVCSVIHEDVDDNFDPSLFTIPLRFNGSFLLPNMVFTEELLILSSNESQALTAELQEKLADLYTASHALGRYFSKAEIYSIRNGSIIADYQLTFVMPEEQQDQLRNFTLSREMVYNVLRQFLYDQESDDSAPAYIDPLSLNMFGRLW